MISSQAMLKLTHSFSRYTKLTCENINYNTTHVKRYSHLCSGRNTCDTLYTQYAIADSFAYTSHQVRPFASIRKKPRVKRPQTSSSEARATIQMNSHYLPSISYFPRARNFPMAYDNSMDWDGPTASSNNFDSKRRDKIPSDFRRWEWIAKKSKGQPFRFKIVSYNVLAQYLLECHPYLYTGCDPNDLSWPIRSERLYREIMDLDPDIICLQEVQSTHLKSFYARFEQCGYRGLYKQKTGDREDGCAIYFKTSVFDLADYISVEYNQPAMEILNRDNVGLIAKLVACEDPTTTIVVATTHLLYNPKRSDVRLAQMQVLLAELDRFAYFEANDGKNTGYHPIVLTGDFNSLPESAVIRLLDMGKVWTGGQRDNSDWRRIAVTDNCQHLAVYVNRPRGLTCDFSMLGLYNSELAGSEEPPPRPAAPVPREPPPPGVTDTDTDTDMDMDMLRYNCLFNSSTVTHPFRLASVYPRDQFDRTLEPTTYQNKWVTVDYIYFSCCNKLQLLESWRLPTLQECDLLGRLPNAAYGSDHLMLAAHFEIRPVHGVH